ncbi:MAG: PaaI family thioesterase [Desulfovibrio sp.]|jgi:acyl-CoA thioesterase|nr:PaaI family thioesterase [Desulfovibrio sp.]
MENYVARHDKLVRHLNIAIEEARKDYAKVTMPLTEHHKNGMGVAHGGAIFSLADVAFGAAANADAKTVVVSLNTAIEFLRPGKTGPLAAEAKIVRSGQHIISYDVEIFDFYGELIAKAMCTGFLTDIPLPE